MEHYHQVVPEIVCEKFKDFLGRILPLNIDWDLYEHPLDTPIEPVTDWPGQQ